MTPTEPGWYWYQDADYGPAPVFVDWCGFVDRHDERYLSIENACGDDCYQPLGPISELPADGEWLGRIEEPKKTSLSEEFREMREEIAKLNSGESRPAEGPGGQQEDLQPCR